MKEQSEESLQAFIDARSSIKSEQQNLEITSSSSSDTEPSSLKNSSKPSSKMILCGVIEPTFIE